MSQICLYTAAVARRREVMPSCTIISPNFVVLWFGSVVTPVNSGQDPRLITLVVCVWWHSLASLEV